jgi:tetratricopeptide (TPR) repeat protein
MRRSVSPTLRGWRPDDEALLARLEDEILLERAWVALAGVHGPPPHPRAAGAVAALRERGEGTVAIEQAMRGDLAPLLRLIAEPDPKTLTPPLAHHLALLFDAVASALERAREPVERAGAEKARVRSLAMWLWLAEESAYLLHMARVVVGGALSDAEVARAASEAPFEAIARLGERAKDGARELSETSRLALRSLARTGEAAEMAGAGEKLRKHAERRAARARSAAIDDALARIADAMDDAAARAPSFEELRKMFSDAAAVWRWADRDEEVEHFLVERVTPFLWDLYRERRWSELRDVLVPIEEAVDHLAARVERDPTKLAYAAPCAQLIVFRAEVARTFDQQIQIAERAIAICPTHRNGRLVLADLLVERAMNRLDAAMPWAGGDALEKAVSEVKRAIELFPNLKRLDDARARLKSMGRSLDA